MIVLLTVITANKFWRLRGRQVGLVGPARLVSPWLAVVGGCVAALLWLRGQRGPSAVGAWTRRAGRPVPSCRNCSPHRFKFGALGRWCCGGWGAHSNVAPCCWHHGAEKNNEKGA